ncbi:uncharacterized protein BDR25DRAFT_352872, partial [Lindgomyces ingoldianus]
IVKLLLDKDADVNAQGGEYSNALHAASEEGHEQIVKQLLKKGAKSYVYRQYESDLWQARPCLRGGWLTRSSYAMRWQFCLADSRRERPACEDFAQLHT